MKNNDKNTEVSQSCKNAVSGSVFLQAGMHVKIINDEKGFPMDSGKTLEITKNCVMYNGERSYELDNRKGDIFLLEDFEYCIEYPELPMR